MVFLLRDEDDESRALTKEWGHVISHDGESTPVPCG